MIPSPNLDDRTYQQIVDEAIGLIPRYCPEWTNFNPTDPGITLIELFAWMSEMMIYRLNKIPEKTYLALLDLVGVSLAPAQASKVLLSFTPVEGFDNAIAVKKSTKVSTLRSAIGDVLTFETEKDLVVSRKIMSSFIETINGKISDFSEIYLENEGLLRPVPLFSGEQEIDRYLYISDESFIHLNDDNSIQIKFIKNGLVGIREDEIINFLNWECWNGSKWVYIDSSRIISGQKQKDNEIYISGPVLLEETEIRGTSGYFIRAYLDDVPTKTSCFDLYGIESRLLFGGDGLLPDICFANNSNMVFSTIDYSKDFEPYQGTPKYNDSFYIASDEVFSKKGSEVIINMSISSGMINEESDSNEHLKLKIEYWNGRTWLVIGESSPKGVLSPTGSSQFLDTTCCFIKTGKISFLAPEDITKLEVNGSNNYWIRIRIVAGDFGKGGQHIRDDDGKWDWNFASPVKPPLLSDISLKYLVKAEPPKSLLTYENFEYINYTTKCTNNHELNLVGKKDERESFSVFNLKTEKEPMTYMGFDNKFPAGDTSIYFKVNENIRSNSPISFNPSMGSTKRSVSLRWEFFDGKKWNKLGINDYTDNFHKSGFIEFTVPINWEQNTIFGKEHYWLRIVFESGSFEKKIIIENILFNSVHAENHQLVEEELLGTSNGSPSQTFMPLKGSLLPNQVLIVKEESIPPQNERDVIIKEEGLDAIKENKDGSVWITYHQVDNFYSSTSGSRHYVVDYATSQILLGNGQNGMVPPRVKNNIKLKKYYSGGGAIGNVGSNTITVLRENIPYLKSVNNFFKAGGGSNYEDLDSLKKRGSGIFKNLNRAVTAEDYEVLSLEASTSVGRAKCLSGTRKDGSIVVIIIPKMESINTDLSTKLFPSKELLKRAYEYLDQRKILGTKLRIEPPVYKEVGIEVKFVFNMGILDRQLSKKLVKTQIFRYLHPIFGGPKSEGSSFGVNISKSDIINIVSRLEDIYFVESVMFFNVDTKEEYEEIKLREDELVYVKTLNVIDRDFQ